MVFSMQSFSGTLPNDKAPVGPRLSGDEWAMILHALDAYRHHAVFRSLHEKIAASQSAGFPRS